MADVEHIACRYPSDSKTNAHVEVKRASPSKKPNEPLHIYYI
jgi:hypothetical protein